MRHWPGDIRDNMRAASANYGLAVAQALVQRSKAEVSFTGAGFTCPGGSATTSSATHC
jgi:hypothetical protein